MATELTAFLVENQDGLIFAVFNATALLGSIWLARAASKGIVR